MKISFLKLGIRFADKTNKLNAELIRLDKSGGFDVGSKSPGKNNFLGGKK